MFLKFFKITLQLFSEIKIEKLEAKERIIQGSIELMNAQGVKSTTMDDVARHLGVSKRTIYENFGDKQNLVRAVVEERIRAIKEEHVESTKGCQDVIDELFASLKNKELTFAKHGRIAREVKRHYPDIYASYYLKNIEESYKEMVESIHRGIEQGLFCEGTNARLVAFMLFETVNVLLHNNERVEEIADTSMANAIGIAIIYSHRAIATQQGIEKIDATIQKHYSNRANK